MMQIVAPIDIEDALRIDLSTLYESIGITGVSFSAPPIEPELGEIPATGVLVCFKRVGGSRDSLVIDTHAVSIDLYAQSWADAITEGDKLAGALSQLPYQQSTSIQYHSVSIATMPYALPDPSNPVLCRVRMLVDVIVKSDVITTS